MRHVQATHTCYLLLLSRRVYGRHAPDVPGQYAVLTWNLYNMNRGWQALLTPFTASAGPSAEQFYIDAVGHLRPYLTPLAEEEDPVYIIVADWAKSAAIQLLQRGLRCTRA